jgi:hypothetical protein
MNTDRPSPLPPSQRPEPTPPTSASSSVPPEEVSPRSAIGSLKRPQYYLGDGRPPSKGPKRPWDPSIPLPPAFLGALRRDRGDPAG